MKSFKKIRDKLIKPNSAAVVKSSSVAGKDKSWVDVLEEFKVQVGDAEYHQIQLTDTITLLEDRCKELTSLSKDSQLIDTIDRLILKFGPIGTLGSFHRTVQPGGLLVGLG
ncbi:unnamed protein product [Clonostachys rosea f. rosea IK726]|uniref:Uncharacterized protein n=1 Tax=Clonostachys rosea f. rosea IK726 TaxID=1349383 RepID=A0ACA9U8F5_BIOOC|nr:unnamed protein product [Clonostachys rosea f. rosea IK726]